MQAEWRKKNPEKALEASRKHYKKHAKRINSEKSKRYKTDHLYREKVKERERRYKESGRRYEVQSTPDQREKARIRSKIRRSNPQKKEHDYNRQAEWRKKNKDLINSLTENKIKELKPSYVAGCMRISVNDLTNEVYETKKLIIKLKRELKNHNVKIR